MRMCAARVDALVAAAWPNARVEAHEPIQSRPGNGHGRAVERLRLHGGGAPPTAILKWRDDRDDDREGLLYERVLDAALLAPRLLARRSAGRVHAMLLEDAPGRAVDAGDPEQTASAFWAIGRAHAESHRRIVQARLGDWAALVRPGEAPLARVLEELRWPAAAGGGARPAMPSAEDRSDPAVLDQGDLRPDNVLLDPCTGRVTLVDYENLAVRPRSAALAPLVGGRHGWTTGRAPEAALEAYRRAWDGRVR